MRWARLRPCAFVPQALVEIGLDESDRDATGESPKQIAARDAPPRPPPTRDWEAERQGAVGEARWDYTSVMEHTSLRYVRKAMAARRVREIARERQCSWKGCGKFLFDAKRCKVRKPATRACSHRSQNATAGGVELTSSCAPPVLCAHGRCANPPSTATRCANERIGRKGGTGSYADGPSGTAASTTAIARVTCTESTAPRRIDEGSGV